MSKLTRIEPRLLTKEQAAAYCGYCANAFGRHVSEGNLPPAIPGTHRWDRKALDAAIDKLSGLEATMPSDDPYERRRARKRAEQDDRHP